MSVTYVNTPFIITNNQTQFTPEQIWVSFAGSFTDTGVDQTIGTTVVSDFTATWQSFCLTQLLALVSEPSYLAGSKHYTFSLNGFSGRIYINYGTAALTTPPNPSNPGNVPYIVFEPTVAGLTLTPPTPTASNMDLSYVDGVSAPAGTMVRDGITGLALAATSVNPVTASGNIMTSVAGLVPAAANVYNGTELVRIMSSAAAPSAYHNWQSLMTTLQTNTLTSQLNVCSYTSPATGLPASYALSGALFGYSGAPSVSGQAPGFDVMQTYTMTAQFVTDLNPNNANTVLQAAGITAGTPGVNISGTCSVSGAIGIYITQDNLNAGTGIYGNNPPYVVLYSESGTQYAYATVGIVNDLGGRIVGDLMAGMVFGWAASSVNIITNATNTNTDLYGVSFSADTISGLSTGELFFLLSLAGSQNKLQYWIGPNLDTNANNYDPYLYAIALNSEAYGSGFTDRLQGYSNPDTYWYTANPPVIPGSPNQQTFEVVGFVELILGVCTTAGISITLTNDSNQQLSLTDYQLLGHNGPAPLIPSVINEQSSSAGFSLQGAVTPYQLTFTYSPDNESTLLTFVCNVSGSTGITIIPAATGTNAGAWQLGEMPELINGNWVVTFNYTSA